MPKEKIGDIEMYYQVQGQGDPLVLIQGLTMDYTGWLLQSSVFSDTYRVVVFDNRGVGRTDAPQEPYTTAQMADDTAGLLDFLKIEKAHILGLSLGGMIAQEFGIKHPDRVKSLILAGTAACPREGAPRSAHIVRTLLSMAQKGADLETCTRMFMAWAFTPKFFENPDQVQGLGINIRKIFTITFVVASGLAGFGGALNAPLVGVAPYMGFDMLLFAFITVILGGLGSIKGTLVSALIMGQVMSVGGTIYGPLAFVGPFMVMFVVILFRPTGLYGVKGRAFGFEE